MNQQGVDSKGYVMCDYKSCTVVGQLRSISEFLKLDPPKSKDREIRFCFNHIKQISFLYRRYKKIEKRTPMFQCLQNNFWHKGLSIIEIQRLLARATVAIGLRTEFQKLLKKPGHGHMGWIHLIRSNIESGKEYLDERLHGEFTSVAWGSRRRGVQNFRRSKGFFDRYSQPQI